MNWKLVYIETKTTFGPFLGSCQVSRTICTYSNYIELYSIIQELFIVTIVIIINKQLYPMHFFCQTLELALFVIAQWVPRAITFYKSRTKSRYWDAIDVRDKTLMR